MTKLLERNGDGSPNFDVVHLSSATTEVTAELLSDEVEALVANELDTAVLYFAGHGVINAETNSGYIVKTTCRPVV